MDKQRRVFELLFILLFLIGICILVWNNNPYDPFKQVAISKTDSGLTHINSEHVAPVDSTWSEGRSLFKSNCASCHNPTVAQTGPALMGVTKRWDDAGTYKGKSGKQWMHIWIRNWNEAVSDGYPYAISIKQQYNQSAMNTFPNLRDDQIDAIIKYVEAPKQLIGY